MVGDDPRPWALAPRLVAAGCFESVTATRSGAEPTVLTSVGEGEDAFGQLWDLTRGATAGPPIPGIVDGGRAAFGLGTGPVGAGRPLLVVGAEGGLLVLDAADASLVSRCVAPEPRTFSPDLVCLAELRGRTVVACVEFQRAGFPPCLVWDAETGDLLSTFEVYFPKYGAVPDPELVAVPSMTGVVLLTTQEERTDDGGWPPYAYDHPYLAVIDLATGQPRWRLEGGPPIALATTNLGPVAVLDSGDTAGLVAVRFPGGELLSTLAGPPPRVDTVAAGAVAGRDVVVGGRYDGDSATVWELTRPEPLAVIRTSGLRDVAIADGTVVLATRDGLYTMAPDALPASAC